MKELEIRAARENLPEVLAFVDSELEARGCGLGLLTKIDVAVEEIFVNISSYAYGADIGSATIRVEMAGDPLSVTVCFIDSGKPYDPIARPDPNLKAPLKERKKGGLGILMVKKTMDDMTYEYKDGQNILTIRKNLGE